MHNQRVIPAIASVRSASAMICIQVSVNGERRTLAGAANAEALTTSVLTYPESQQTWLRVNGDMTFEGQPNAAAEWLTMQLSVGDKVEIQVLESDTPENPTLSRTDPTRPASDAIPCVCAFCGKDSKQTQGMVASHHAMICRDCIDYLHEMSQAL
jgi:hypothetical protein